MDQGTFGGLSYRTIKKAVPLVWDDPSDQRTIEIFARIVGRPGHEHLPYLVFLQGGPGCEDPRPVLALNQPSWITQATARYQVVLLDQRGTGRSTPVNDSILQDHSAPEVAEYLTHLRADAIVRDAEAIRQELKVEQWNVLGQSFGGFTTLHYLSHFPDSVRYAFFTGGLSAIDRHVDEIYAATYQIMAEKSEEYYRLFPGDRDKLCRALELAEDGKIRLPNGDRLTSSRLRSLGMLLGTNEGAWELHNLLDFDPLSNVFAHEVHAHLPFRGRNPLYAVIHESSYADGCKTDWSAARTYPKAFEEDPTLLTGEHLCRNWFETDSELRPWQEVAELIAQVDWPKLYDAQKLADSQAQGAAAIYVRDAYVPLDFSLETAQLLPGVKTYLTSKHEHNGLRASNGQVLSHLFDLAEGITYR